MDVSVIIVTYNTISITNDCIESIIKHTKGVEYEIIVVDNGSNDGSKELFRNDTRIRYIYSNTNLGFGKANNLGVEHAKGDYIFFLNSDTLLISNAIYELYKCIKDNNEIKAVGAQLLWPDKSEQQSIFKFPTVSTIFLDCLGIKQTIDVSEGIKGSKLKILDNEFISGADLMMSTGTFKEIGGFDESYFMYYEETDLQLRMLKSGCKLAINPDVKIIHINRGSQKNTNSHIFDKRIIYAAKLKTYNDSRKTYFRKNLPYSLMALKCILTIGIVLRVFRLRKYSIPALLNIWRN